MTLWSEICGLSERLIFTCLFYLSALNSLEKVDFAFHELYHEKDLSKEVLKADSALTEGTGAKPKMSSIKLRSLVFSSFDKAIYRETSHVS